MLFVGNNLGTTMLNLNPSNKWRDLCLRPIASLNTSENIPASSLTFNFGSATAVSATTGVITGFIANASVVNLLESVCCGCDSNDEGGIRTTVYIKFTVENSTPAFDPALEHVLTITANNPTLFNELVDLYALYFLDPQTTGLIMTVIPAPTTNQLVIVFPVGYGLNAQTLVLSFVTVASSSSVVVNTAGTLFDVTLGSELFTPNWTYQGTIGLDASASAATQSFKNYANYPERTTQAAEQLLTMIKEKCVQSNTLSEEDLREIKCYLKRKTICVQLSAKCIKVSKAGKCKKSQKACLLRYFTFVTCCLNAFPVLRKKKPVCERLQRDCCNSEDAHSVFCAIAAILSKCHTSINFDLRILIEMMFEVVIGYNPYCNLSKTSGAFYGLCDKDAKIVRDYSHDEGVESTVEGEHTEEEEKISDEEKRKEEEKKRGVFFRYRILIIVSIAFVAVCGGIAVYSFM
jgi:hypothetical protein